MDKDASFVQCNRYKIVFIGDISVGKTSIINQFIEDKFKDAYDPSIGIDFASKTLRFKGRFVKLQIWDTAGQEKYKSLIPSYIRGAAIVFIVYDITNRDSYDNLSNWVNFIEKLQRPNVLVICGNKTDMETERQINIEEGMKISEESNALFYEVSAKDNTNIKKMFYESIANLDCFDDLRDDYKNLGYEIEYENNALSLDNVTIPKTPQSKDNIKIEPKTDKEKEEEIKKRKCKC